AAQDPNAALKQAAMQFETYFVQHMFKTMRESVEKSDLFGSDAADTFQDMLDKEFATRMAERGTLGLAQMLERQLMPPAPASTQDVLEQRGLPVRPVAEPKPLGAAAAEPIALPQRKRYTIDPLDGGRK
ncbi:rod-binding protein, partial [Arthrospira platensis SPKY1]|nr:rod-binding protein [Arthrospira platensis SPKY1]